MRRAQILFASSRVTGLWFGKRGEKKENAPHRIACAEDERRRGGRLGSERGGELLCSLVSCRYGRAGALLTFGGGRANHSQGVAAPPRAAQ
jgi:hypothetical protein